MWDFVYARRLLSNGTYRAIHGAVLGFERCAVAKDRRILDARHPDGAPVYRIEETKPLLGSSRAPRMEALNNGGGTRRTTLRATPRKDAPGPDDRGKAARAGRGGALGLEDALLRGLEAQTADRWVRRYVRGGSAQKLELCAGPWRRKPQSCWSWRHKSST